MTSVSERIQTIADFVRQHLIDAAEQYPSPEHDPVYRYEHTLRVAHYGKLIAEGEGANVEWVVAACLLHDVVHFECEDDYRGHGRRGAAFSRPLLVEWGYSPEAVDNICYSIALHVDGDAGYDFPHTLEADVVSDADNVDRFGAFRVLQTCVYELQPKMGDFAGMMADFAPRLEKLERYSRLNPLETATGKKLFAAQLERQLALFRGLSAELAITAVPTLS